MLKLLASSHCLTVLFHLGLGEFPLLFWSRISPHHSDDDGCLVHHVVQVRRWVGRVVCGGCDGLWVGREVEKMEVKGTNNEEGAFQSSSHPPPYTSLINPTNLYYRLNSISFYSVPGTLMGWNRCGPGPHGVYILVRELEKTSCKAV